jgi:hypothetical protein
MRPTAPPRRGEGFRQADRRAGRDADVNWELKNAVPTGIRDGGERCYARNAS